MVNQMRSVKEPTTHMADQDWEKLEPESAYVKKCRLKHVVSLVEPYGGTMKIISFIEDDTTIKKILKHCGKWKEP